MEMVRAIEVVDRVLEEPTLTPRPTREDLRAYRSPGPRDDRSGTTVTAT
jgi:hypothetical protein